MPTWRIGREQWELHGEDYRGDNISRVKRQLRLSYAEMGTLVGCSGGTIARWCNPRNRRNYNMTMRRTWSCTLAYLFLIQQAGVQTRFRIASAFQHCRQLALDDRGQIIPQVLAIGATESGRSLSWEEISVSPSLNGVVPSDFNVVEDDEEADFEVEMAAEDIEDEEELEMEETEVDECDTGVGKLAEELDTTLDFYLTEGDDDDEAPALLINLRSKRLDPTNVEQMEEMSGWIAKSLQKSLQGKLYAPQKRVMLLRVQMETYNSLIQILTAEREKVRIKLNKLGDNYYE